MAAGILDQNLIQPETLMLRRSLMEGMELERWQRYICETAHVFACCVDAEGEKLTEFGGNSAEVSKVVKAVDGNQLKNLFMKVSESTREDYAMEETGYPNLRLAAISARAGGRTVFGWLVCGVLSDVCGEAAGEAPWLSGVQTSLPRETFDRTVLLLARLSAGLASDWEKQPEGGDGKPEVSGPCTVLEHINCSVCVRALHKDHLIYSNRNMREVFADELQDGSIYTLLGQGKPEESGFREIHLKEKNRWYERHECRIRWEDGSPAVLFVLYDSTEKKLYRQKMEQLAGTDFLTGLYNRMRCEKDLARYVEAAGDSGRRGALLYLDLDDFKHINDGLGHQYGDVLLQAISHSLQRIAGIEKTCYRMGGDEFVIIIPPAHFSECDRIIASIREIFMRPWFLRNADYYCTMSMGVVEFPEGGDAVHDLIRKADISMYEAKRRGKNRVAFYSAGLDSKSGKRLDLEKNMRDAAARGYQEFKVYFQPILDISRKGSPCTGAEALLRWDSAELGLVPPSEFIPLAEYLGLINPIGNYVLKEACRYCKSWNDRGYPDYKVNVNLSVVQLLQPDIVDIIRRTLGETKLEPRNLTLEVTESLAINDMGKMKEILQNIKQLGVRIALDDFGTGYSSLNHIREIPFDVIKVDQSFIKDLEKDAYARSFIRMITQLAEAIGVNLCVEGVAEKSQYQILAGMRVNLVQGYYFDRPMPPEAFERKYVGAKEDPQR